MPERQLRLATILSHPDDETFGIGGTLIKYTDAGVECHSLSLTQGEAGANGDPADPIPRERLGEARAAELAEAGRRMGIASTTCFTYPDGKLAQASAADVVRDIVRWLRAKRPDVVITWGPDGGYGHPDHVATGPLTLHAIELAGIQRHEPGLGEHVHVRRCYQTVVPAAAFDRLRELAPDFAAYMDTLAVRPHRWTEEELGAVIDIRDVADRKWHAMQAHRSQVVDLERLARLRDTMGFVTQEETYIRAFPDPGGPPLETDLFAGVKR
ncbi:MAG TPA: PIG-L deacetylase family protein [Candidatus Limnocylindria bacterium]|nr:PIG-L deacetylase family protein [Candidatus Limnocylindria bacterium]